MSTHVETIIWRSVEEAMPEPNRSVIIVVRIVVRGFCVCEVGYLYRGGKWMAEDDHSVRNVLAWAPLPKGPQ